MFCICVPVVFALPVFLRLSGFCSVLEGLLRRMNAIFLLSFPLSIPSFSPTEILLKKGHIRRGVREE
jgi:hypothetical protein